VEHKLRREINQMKKIVMAVVLIVAACGISVQAAQTDWANQTEIYDWFGVEIPDASTWIIRMYESADDQVNFALGLPGGNDSWSGVEFSWNSQGAPGFAVAIIDNSDTTYGFAQDNFCYSVIFNSSSFEAATKFAIIDDSMSIVNYGGGPSFSYDAGGVVAGDWQAIPEPATFGLMALGGGIAWLVRLKQRIG
jgi:hypothetical protein